MKRRSLSFLAGLLTLVLFIGTVPFAAAADPTPVNLYDPAAAVVGWVHSTMGSSPDGSFRTSDYIPVAGGDVMTFGAAVTTQGWHIVRYDADKAVLGDVTLAAGIEVAEKLDDTTSVMTYSVPDGTAYLRFIADARYAEVYRVTKNAPFDAAGYREFFGLQKPGYHEPDGNNLFDPAQAIVGHINAQGDHFPDGAFRTSAPIAVEAGDTVWFGAAVKTQGWHLVLLDESQTAFAVATRSTGIEIAEDLDDETAIMSYVAENGTAYLRFVLDARYQNAYVITRGQELTAERYYELTGLEPPEPVNPDPGPGPGEDNPLKGKRALFCGDSISQGTWDTDDLETPNYQQLAWAVRIGTAYGMIADNVSIGGTSLSTIRGGRIVDQVKSKRYTEYDYVILQGGVNDAWGSVETGVVAEPGEMSLSFDPAAFDITTFAGGLEETFYYAFEYYPTAKIGYIITFATPNSGGIGRTQNMEDYYRVAKQICEKWGVPYLDLYHDNYVNNELLKVRTYTYMRDSIHPNKAGYDRLAPYIGKWMETLDDNDVYRRNPLYQKTALFCGDSISYGSSDSTGGRAWAGRIGEAYGMTVDNRSVSGWSLSTARGARIVQQVRDAKNGEYDYVILHGGVNDAWESAPVGVMSDSFERRDFDSSTYGGALEETFYYAKKQFPGARIGYIVNFATPNATTIGRCADMEEYYALGKQICEKWGVACLDLYHDAYVNDTLLAVTTLQYMADSIHPNAAGYDRLAPYIGQWMETLVPWTAYVRSQPADYTALDAAIAALPDLRLCTPDSAAAVQAVLDAVERELTLADQARVDGWLAQLTEAVDRLQPALALGDINGDEAVNAADALLALQHSVKLTTLEEPAFTAADVSGDGAVNSADALLILQKSVRLIDKFPVENN